MARPSLLPAQANVVGASGAVYTLVGAWVAFTTINWDTLNGARKYLQAGFLGILTCLDFGSAIYQRYNGEGKGVPLVTCADMHLRNCPRCLLLTTVAALLGGASFTESKVSFAGHMGGFLMGVTFGTYILKVIEPGVSPPAWLPGPFHHSQPHL